MLYRLYAFKFLKNCSFWMPVYVLFLRERGLTFSQIGVLFGVQSVCQALAEYPTGVGADLWSRKTALVASGILKVLYISIVVLAHRFPLFVLSYVLYGLSLACENGADSAYAFEYLSRHQETGKFLEVEGNSYFFHLIARSAAGIVGSLLAAAGLVVPVIASLAAFILALALSLGFEPDRRPRVAASLGEQLSRHTKKTASKIAASRELQAAILFYAALSAAIALAFIYFQPLLTRTGIDVKWFGIIYSVWLACSALSSLSAARVFGRAPPAAASGGLLLLSVAPLAIFACRSVVCAILAGALIQCAFGLIRPVLYNRINARCEEGQRTSMLSVAGLVQCAIVAVASPLLGRVADGSGLDPVLLALAVLALAGGLPLLLSDARTRAPRRGLEVSAVEASAP